MNDIGVSENQIEYRNGIMGVPITFFDKFNPDQFELLGVFNHGKDGPWDFAVAKVNGIEKYKRLAIRKKD